MQLSEALKIGPGDMAALDGAGGEYAAGPWDCPE